MKRRTEITIEIDRVMIISQSKNRRPWCDTCGRQVSMVTVGEAASMIQTGESVIYGLAETGKLHFATTTAGLLLICPDSLLALLEDESASPTGKLLIV
jgi:hypothetical protein